MYKASKIIKILLLGFLVVIVGVNVGFGFKQKDKKNYLEQKEFRQEELYISQSNVAIGDLINQLPNGESWRLFLKQNEGSYVYIDPRSGRPSSIVSAIPIIPGSGVGNRITFEDISRRLGYEVKEITEVEVKLLVKDFLKDYSELLRINPDEIAEIRVGHPLDYLWQVFITRQVKGIEVRDANIALVINHGNLILWGLEKWGEINNSLQAKVSEQEAMRIISDFVEGFSSKDEMIQKLHLELVPVSPSSYTGVLGTGYSYRLAWVMKFKKSGYNNTWEVMVDAEDGRILSFQDINQYVLKKIVGSIYPVSDDECCPEGCAIPSSPMAYTDTGFAAPNN